MVPQPNPTKQGGTLLVNPQATTADTLPMYQNTVNVGPAGCQGSYRVRTKYVEQQRGTVARYSARPAGQVHVNTQSSKQDG